MRPIIPKTETGWLELVYGRFITNRTLSDYPLLNKAVTYTLQSKGLLFYEPTFTSERANGSGFLQWSEIRTYTGSDAVAMQSLYWLHEFIHAVFPYLINLKGRTIDEYIALYQRPAEYLASNASEVQVYFDLPGFREQVFLDKEIFYDRLVAGHTTLFRSWPNTAQLWKLRETLLTTTSLDWLFWGPVGSDNDPVREWMKHWGEQNEHWLKERFRALSSKTFTGQYHYQGLSHAGFREELMAHQFEYNEKRYERLVVQNCALLYELLGRQDFPSSFGECLERVPYELDDVRYPLVHVSNF